MGFDTISKQGALEYLTAYVEAIKERIEDNDPQKILYEEQVLFFGKAIEIIKKKRKEELKEAE